jgi:hypothetical protein
MNRLIRLAVPVMRLVGRAPQVAFLTAEELESDMVAAGLGIIERARHGSKGKDPHIFMEAERA